VLEAASNPRTRQITVLTASQSGKTSALLSIIGHRFGDGPRYPCLFVLPTQKLAKSMSDDRVRRLIADCPQLDTIHQKGQKDALFEKWLGGVPLRFAWAGSATELASHPCGIALVDEYSRMTRDVAGEGDPLTLVKARTSNYPAPLVLVTSTPTIEDVDATQAQFDQSSMEIWRWQCPHCSTWSRPLSKYLQWPAGSTADQAARDWSYACPSCGASITEDERRGMIAGGQFWPHLRDNDGEYQPREDGEIQDHQHRGFWVSGFASPWATFSSLARELCAAYRSQEPETIQGTINTKLGEVWRMRGDAPDWQDVAAHKGNYLPRDLPYGVQVLTMGCDVQQDRIYYVLRGWGAEQGPMESWLIEHGELHGRTDSDEVWVSLGQLMRRHGLVPKRVLVDSGYRPGTDFFKRPDHSVYAFCRRETGRAFPSKGFESRDKPVDSGLIDVNQGSLIIKNGLRLFRVSTSYWKQWVYSRIRLGEEESDLWHVHKEVTEDYMRQCVAEELITTAAGRMQWIARRTKPNHYLDCEVLAAAAAHSLNLYTLPPLQKKVVQASAPPAQRESIYARREL